MTFPVTMATQLKHFATFFILLLTVVSAHCQQIKLIQLPILQDATWLVTGISQDPQGYIWLSTKRTGLYRYDGYNIISYKNQVSNPNTLAYDAIETLHADSKGIIWIDTFGRGLDRFDPSTGNFTHFNVENKALPNDTITAIAEDRRGDLWVGSYGGISLLDQKTGKFTSYRHNESDSSSLSCDQVRTVYQHRQGIIWVGTGSSFFENPVCHSGGLNRLIKIQVSLPGAQVSLVIPAL